MQTLVFLCIENSCRSQIAQAFAKKYASKPPLPSQMIKRSVNALTYQADQAIMHMDYDQFLLAREFHKE